MNNALIDPNKNHSFVDKKKYQEILVVLNHLNSVVTMEYWGFFLWHLRRVALVWGCFFVPDLIAFIACLNPIGYMICSALMFITPFFIMLWVLVWFWMWRKKQFKIDTEEMIRLLDLYRCDIGQEHFEFLMYVLIAYLTAFSGRWRKWFKELAEKSYSYSAAYIAYKFKLTSSK